MSDGSTGRVLWHDDNWCVLPTSGQHVFSRVVLTVMFLTDAPLPAEIRRTNLLVQRDSALLDRRLHYS
eukprot:6190984-Pleurochrysis_carterae.AAC.7